MSFFDWMTETYGSQLERLTKTQKFYLLIQIATKMGETCRNLEGSDPYYKQVDDSELEQFVELVYTNVSWRDVLSFLEALVSQIKTQPIPE
ncbi:hypothetical protein H6G81_23595 [Scytonema hofmannii FACHB-248]|uniref:Uncharacterized protein n=1 Tax=Scytonema hofmannii FACHB-248 TaxID=1842502 RepID=A0ABR8GVM1_9CYAN|nr:MULTISPECIES: hypothetical protein [Nostocales]MBD2607428.1 hypothetical protein [Scytonema hofmannii FACHB-248]